MRQDIQRRHALTCNRVFYNAETTSRTTAQDTYYVSISRERHEVVVFTDNAQRLPDAVEREAYKGVAHDLVAQELQKLWLSWILQTTLLNCLQGQLIKSKVFLINLRYNCLTNVVQKGE